MYNEEVVARAQAIHKEVYGVEPATVSYAPGRIEVLGNHTDYNAGTAFSCAINFGHCFCISKSDKPGIHVTAGERKESCEFSATCDERVDRYWANYVKGIFYYLAAEHAILIDGINCTFLGSIPMGAGLSSSAALEVSAAYAALQYAGKKVGVDVSKKDIGILAQKCENIFAGCSCGLLDQFSSIFGEHHRLIHSDFRSLETYTVKLPDDVMFLMVNPHIKHKLNDSPYNARRQSCEKAAVQLNEHLSYDVKTLRDVTWEDFEANKDKIDAEAAQRATHIVWEIHRVEEGARLLSEGKVEAFGQLMYDSHETSRTAFENSLPELDRIVAAAKDAGALGARLSGGGWGGSVCALVKVADADKICEQIIEICKAKGLDPTIERIVPSQGAQVIQ